MVYYGVDIYKERDMYFDAYTASEVAKSNIHQAEGQAARNWRFRRFKSRESRFAVAVLTSILGLFVR